MDKDSCLVACSSGESFSEPVQLAFVATASAITAVLSGNLALAMTLGTTQNTLLVCGLTVVQQIMSWIPVLCWTASILSALLTIYAIYCIYLVIRAGPNK